MRALPQTRSGGTRATGASDQRIDERAIRSTRDRTGDRRPQRPTQRSAPFHVGTSRIDPPDSAPSIRIAWVPGSIGVSDGAPRRPRYSERHVASVRSAGCRLGATRGIRARQRHGRAQAAFRGRGQLSLSAGRLKNQAGELVELVVRPRHDRRARWLRRAPVAADPTRAEPCRRRGRRAAPLEPDAHPSEREQRRSDPTTQPARGCRRAPASSEEIAGEVPQPGITAATSTARPDQRHSSSGPLMRSGQSSAAAAKDPERIH